MEIPAASGDYIPIPRLAAHKNSKIAKGKEDKFNVNPPHSKMILLLTAHVKAHQVFYPYLNVFRTKKKKTKTVQPKKQPA